jgi:hypothetical protein
MCVGIVVGVAFGPFAWRMGYRCASETTESRVEKPWW